MVRTVDGPVRAIVFTLVPVAGAAMVPLRLPSTVGAFAAMVTVGVVPRATPPVPRFSEDEPVKAKVPFQFWLLLVARVMGKVEVLSNVPPVMVNGPVPMALALLMLKE